MTITHNIKGIGVRQRVGGGGSKVAQIGVTSFMNDPKQRNFEFKAGLKASFGDF